MLRILVASMLFCLSADAWAGPPGRVMSTGIASLRATGSEENIYGSYYMQKWMRSNARLLWEGEERLPIMIVLDYPDTVHNSNDLRLLKRRTWLQGVTVRLFDDKTGAMVYEQPLSEGETVVAPRGRKIPEGVLAPGGRITKKESVVLYSDKFRPSLGTLYRIELGKVDSLLAEVDPGLELVQGPLYIEVKRPETDEERSFILEVKVGMLFLEKKYSESIAAGREALAKNPALPSVRTTMCEGMRRLGDLKECPPLLKAGLSHCRIEDSRMRLERAIKYYQACIDGACPAGRY